MRVVLECLTGPCHLHYVAPLMAPKDIGEGTSRQALSFPLDPFVFKFRRPEYASIAVDEDFEPVEVFRWGAIVACGGGSVKKCEQI